MVKTKFVLHNVALEITKTCNERCLHCYVPKYERVVNKYMHIRDAKYYLDQANELGVKSITITGGEPFLHKDIFEIMKYADNLGFSKIYLLSNLTLLETKDISILKDLKSLSVRTTVFSLDQSIHDEITGLKGSLEKTLNTIVNLKAEGVEIQVSCPLLKRNLHSFIELQKWADDHGYPLYPNFDIVSLINYDTKNQKYTVSSYEKVKLMKELIILVQHPLWSGWKNLIDDVRKLDLTENPCEAGITQLVIDANGEVYPCLLWRRNNIGNLNNTPLREIWNNSEILASIRKTRLKDFKLGRGSDYIKFVRICYARNANAHNGDYMKISQEDFNYGKMLKEMILEINEI